MRAIRIHEDGGPEVLRLEEVEDPASIVSGLEAVRQQALAVLADLGYPLRADLNEPFDPSRHEAVAVLPATDAAPGTILQVVRPGYGTDERPLRPAAVVVAKGS